MGLLKALFGDYSKKEIKRIRPLCDKVLSYEDTYSKMSDKELKNQTVLFRERLEKGETLDSYCPRHSQFAERHPGVYLV